MDKLDAMRAFCSAAKEGNFAAAARAMGCSRAQVNKQVIWLEDQLSVSLFHRTTRRVSLTPSGRAYLEQAERILADIAEAESMVQNDQQQLQGTLRINAPMTFGSLHLTQAITAFMQLHPHIKVQLLLSDEKIDPLSNQFDMTVRIGQPQDSLALIEQPLCDTRPVLCCAPTFLTQYPEPKTVEQLKQMPCIHYDLLPSGHNWDFLYQGKHKRVKIAAIFSSNNGGALMLAALDGLGVAYLPSFIVAKAIQQRRLVQLLADHETTPLAISLLYAPNRHLAQRLRVFVKFLQARFHSQKGW